MVLLPAAVPTIPAYRCLVPVESAEQAQSRQTAQKGRAARLARWFRHGRALLGRRALPPRFFAQLGLGSAVEREVCRQQRQVPVAWVSPARLVSARVVLLRVTAVPVEATLGMQARRTATVTKTARVTARVVKAAWAILARSRAAPKLVSPGVSPSRAERPAPAKAALSVCRAGP